MRQVARGREDKMTTADQVMERALALARAGSETDQAARELMECCGDKRVSVVLARRSVSEQDDGTDPMNERAGELLDEVLRRLPPA